jgi:hypothetical protein
MRMGGAFISTWKSGSGSMRLKISMVKLWLFQGCAVASSRSMTTYLRKEMGSLTESPLVLWLCYAILPIGLQEKRSPHM